MSGAMADAAGALITVEGIDGTGKSTVVAGLGRWLAAAGVKAAVQREPTQSWLGEAVRKSHTLRVDPLTQTFLFLADRAHHCEAMRAEIALGAVIVCDRYFDSTIAYQGAALAGKTEPYESLKWLRALHNPWVLVPDLTLLIVDDPAKCIERVKARGAASMFESAEFLTKVQDNYRKAAAAEPDRFRVLEGSDLPSIEAGCKAQIEKLLRARGLMAAPPAP
jgi:dTMP kinase